MKDKGKVKGRDWTEEEIKTCCKDSKEPPREEPIMACHGKNMIYVLYMSIRCATGKGRARDEKTDWTRRRDVEPGGKLDGEEGRGDTVDDDLLQQYNLQILRYNDKTLQSSDFLDEAADACRDFSNSSSTTSTL